STASSESVRTVFTQSWSVSSNGRFIHTPWTRLAARVGTLPPAGPDNFRPIGSPHGTTPPHRSDTTMTLRAGVDLGGTKIQTVVIDDDDRVLGQSRHPTPKDHGPAGVADEIVATVEEAMTQAGAVASDLTGIGIGAPGTSDDTAGTVTQARNVTPDWTGSFALAEAGSRPLGGLPVRLGNDVKVGTIAEARPGAGARPPPP